ncbi:hypothetical protein THAOC_08628 [Thalassiosira oceanica]|uniref:SAM domain-containing protein n=1 Tax=Thalassiosira oceanica TaxID=159749 RepID=K0THQ3_THAOC|nr:hypothetical protein THAOC_08628 [Thalassiosira oceanica]|eukprot:EJK70052.1 hypothetical protein THAOC_08628 [Thalassiosira oceanica]
MSRAIVLSPSKQQHAAAESWSPSDQHALFEDTKHALFEDSISPISELNSFEIEDGPHREGCGGSAARDVSETDGRDGLHTFLHSELRISSEVAEKYCNSLVENGYDDVASLQDATEHDLKELGVKIGHIRRIERAVLSNRMRQERRASFGITSSSRRMAELNLKANDFSADESVVVTETIEQGSLLSEFARQEVSNYSSTPPPATTLELSSSVDLDLANAKELLIRKQAEKIASLEARLLTAGVSMARADEQSLSAARLSRGGSAETGNSKKLTPEERLEAHRQRKLQENKYKEKTGVWDAPPPKQKSNSLAEKVAENDDLVLKLTSDPSNRKKIDEVEKATRNGSRKMLHGELSGFGSGGSKPPLSPTSNPAFERARSDSSAATKQVAECHRHSTSSRRSSRGDDQSSIASSSRHRAVQQRMCCETCGSTRDCEPDVDNPGVYYCKRCWDEYDAELNGGSSSGQLQQQTHAQQSSLLEEPSCIPPPPEDDTHHALWIVHDNPQLGDKIVYSGPRRMECMLETKEPGKKNCVRVVVGDIDFSGKVELSGIGNVDGRESDQGTECIRVRNARGYCVDHNQAASRLSRDKTIYEFQLGDENATVLTGKSATKSVGEFFKGCVGAIDVILDPQRDFGGWYPQKEARSGGRKIAPQFRSKGVGYIRLGDDMSENGLAFLSSNAGISFLSSSKTKVAKKPSSSSRLPKHKSREDSNRPHAAPKPRTSSTQRRKPSQRQQQQRPSDDSDSDDESSDEEAPKVGDVLKQLQNPGAGMKWKDKADLISQLGKGASSQDGKHSRTAALNVIEVNLGAKNVNVHIVRSALIAAGMIGVSMGGEMVAQVSWKTIMIETVKLLKSKQCSSVAKTVLAQLHGRCFTLANSLEAVSHVLGVGLSSSSSKGRSSKKATAMESPNPRKTSAGGGNSVEVIEWLAETTERERHLEGVEPMLERNSLAMLINLFFSHADHRDQRCRRNVMDGLMHCVLYGVQRLNLDLTRMMRMCAGLKETNSRGWNQIFSSAKMILEEESR